MMLRRAPTRSILAATPRDQHGSAFAHILTEMLLSLPGGRAAALVDSVGEAVDYAGLLDPYEVKIAAAHLQIVIARIALPEPWRPVRQLVVRTSRRAFVVRAIEEGYVLVVVLQPFATRSAESRAIDVAHALIRSEAGWDAAGPTASWYRAEVTEDSNDGRRPTKMRVASRWETIEVLGTLVALGPGDRGFRVRLSRGAELCLVRERFGAWYADANLGE